jgi:hypothetical protein
MFQATARLYDKAHKVIAEHTASSQTNYYFFKRAPPRTYSSQSRATTRRRGVQPVT